VASYQFDIAKVSAGIINANTGSTGVTVSKYFAGAQIPVTKNIRINTVYQQVKNQVNGYTPKSQSVMAVYDFSKRTAMYAGMAMSQQDGNSTLPIVSSSKWSYTDSTGTRVAGASPAAGQNQTAYMVGVRHAF
jgi:predicted porin